MKSKKKCRSWQALNKTPYIENGPIVKPIKGKHPPNIGHLTVMISSGKDLSDVCAAIPLNNRPKPLMMSRLYTDSSAGARYSVIGPIIGAPYAVMLLETMITWGASSFIFLGWCGSISPDIHIGDVIVADEALIDEGTSVGYGKRRYAGSAPSDTMQHDILQLLKDRHIPHHTGKVWTTDAIFQETPEKIKQFRESGAVAVEMEASALFTVAQMHNVTMGAILIVSDELATMTWRPGFKKPAFHAARQQVIEVIKTICLKT